MARQGKAIKNKEKEMEKLKVTLRGIAPLLTHNGMLVDPRNVFTREIDAAQKAYKKAKSDAAFDALAKVEWLGGLYTDAPITFTRDGNTVEVKTDANIGLIGEQIERSIIKAVGVKEVRAFKAGVIVEGFFPLIVGGKKMTVQRSFGDARFALTVPAKIGMAKVMRTRPHFPEWEIEAVVNYNDALIKKRDLQDAIVRAGQTIGVGDWRPKFGRFEVA
jgi:hypothetical protein